MGRVKDARLPKPRRERGSSEVFDVVTPTERQARLEGIARRQRLYFRWMVPAISLVAFGFFIPAPIPLRLAALVIATGLGAVAVVLGNTR